MALMERVPLLNGGRPKEQEGNDEWSQGQIEQWADCAEHVMQSAGDGHVEVNRSGIREAASQGLYPQWIHGALVAPQNDGRVDSGVNSGEELPIQPSSRALPSPDVSSSVNGLREDEIRELIVDHVDHRCCWGRRPASKWKMKKVEDCKAFKGTLETFIEEREVYKEVEPYSGQPYTASVLGPWEVDRRDEFPSLFTARKEARTNIPFSQNVEICTTCSGKKGTPCVACHPSDKPGEFGTGKRAACSRCSGRGLIAHQDGSDSECRQCKGTGEKDCKQCNSSGLVKCNACSGYGSLLHSQFLVVRWRTLMNKKVSASSSAATLPDQVLHEASGIQLPSYQSHTCQPVQFPNSPDLTNLSADVFATREAVPPIARVIKERHQLTLIPVTRVVMYEGDNSFQFYIIGLGKQIYMRHYPATCALCCCVQMCTVQ